MADLKQPSYNIYFDCRDLDGALACLNVYGYCVIRKMISLELVDELTASIEAHLDPDRDLAPASNRYHMTFAEVSRPLWKLVEHVPYRHYLHKVHGTTDLCLHRTAAILRTAGEPMGTWHTDDRSHVVVPQVANDVLNRYGMPNGSWFYLNGSHPDRGGLAVIERSHLPDWTGPKGFALTADGNSFHREGDLHKAGYRKMDVPGCIALIAEPQDLIVFAVRTFHTNMATHQRRHSFGTVFRPRSIRVEAPWPLPESAQKIAAWLPAQLRPYTEGYPSFDGNWRGPGEGGGTQKRRRFTTEDAEERREEG